MTTGVGGMDADCESAVRQGTGAQSLRDGKLELRAVADAMVHGLIIIDADGIVEVFNPACEALFGYDADEVIGRDVQMLVPKAPAGLERDGDLDQYFRTGARSALGAAREVLALHRDGTTFPVDLSVGEIVQSDKTRFVGVFHDRSGRKRVNAQLVQAQKMEVVGQLSGGIAHDFNNLLTVIIGNSDLLEAELLDRPNLRALCAAITAAGERGAQLTHRLLAFSRRQPLQPVALDCNRHVGEIQQILRRTLREDIEIRAVLDPALSTVVADPGQLESALLNLALNAQDAMPGGGCLTITTANALLDEHNRDNPQQVRPGWYVLVSVTDDGMGMPAEVRDRAFEPFFTTKEVGKGSGLGLSMVYGFAKQSKGHVSLTSEPGLGTTVRLYLPAEQSGVSAAADVTPEARKVEPKGSATVLVVEDDDLVRSYAIACLEGLGYRVIPAGNAAEALALLEQGAAPDVLFGDIVMPGGLSGWELARQARKIRPGLKVLMTSGYENLQIATGGRAEDSAFVLGKPYRRSELAQRMRDALAAEPV